MRRLPFRKNPIALVCAIVCLSCLVVLIISAIRLPQVSIRNKAVDSIRSTSKKSVNPLYDDAIGTYGKMLLKMLPEDLAFTIFMPSDRSFELDLRLHVDDNLAAEKLNDTYAIVSRILGFSAVPRIIDSSMVPSGKEIINYDSLSGYTLYIWKDLDGVLVANGIRSDQVDLRKEMIVVHVMKGVLMDAEFKQSIQSDYDQDEDA